MSVSAHLQVFWSILGSGLVGRKMIETSRQRLGQLLVSVRSLPIQGKPDNPRPVESVLPEQPLSRTSIQSLPSPQQTLFSSLSSTGNSTKLVGSRDEIVIANLRLFNTCQ